MISKTCHDLIPYLVCNINVKDTGHLFFWCSDLKQKSAKELGLIYFPVL